MAYIVPAPSVRPCVCPSICPSYCSNQCFIHTACICYGSPHLKRLWSLSSEFWIFSEFLCHTVLLLSALVFHVGVGVSVTPIIKGQLAQIFPLGWGLTYCFTVVGVGVPCWCLRQHHMNYCVDFCYDLDLVKLLDLFRYLFFLYFIKSMNGILIKHCGKLHKHLAHDPIIVDL